jgi:hypothetical protein
MHMRIEATIYLTAFTLLGTSLLLSRRGRRHAAVEEERRQQAELDRLFRPVLLFHTTAQVAYC